MTTLKYSLIVLLLLIGSNAKEEFSLKKNLVIRDKNIAFASHNLVLKVDAKGQIFVANKKENSVWLYTKKGNLKKQLSREGRGPGEVISLKDMYLDEIGVLYVLDRNLGKIAVFKPPSYKPSNFIHIPPLVNNQIPQKIYINSDEKYLVSFSEQLSIQHPKHKKNTLYAIDKSGIIKDTLLKYTADQDFIYTKGNSISTSQVPFGYHSIIHLGMKGDIYWGKTNQNYIQKFDKDGKPLIKIKLSFKKVEIPEKYINRMHELAYSKSDGDQFFRQMWEAGVIPSEEPYYNWFLIDNKKRVWVAGNVKNMQNQLLKVFNKQNKKIAETMIPRTLKLEAVRGDNAYGIKTGKKGAQSVVRYKVQGLN